MAREDNGRNKQISSRNYLRHRSGSATSRNSSGGSQSRQSNATHSGPCWNGCMCDSNHCDFCASSAKSSRKGNFHEDPIMYPKQYQPQQNSMRFDKNSPVFGGTSVTGSTWFTPRGKIISHGNSSKYSSVLRNGLPVVPGASDISNSTPTLSSVSSKTSNYTPTLSSVSGRSDGSGTTLSGLSDLQSLNETMNGKMKDEPKSTAKESDSSDIEEVPVPPKPTPPLVELDE